jgi:hypothetical protein
MAKRAGPLMPAPRREITALALASRRTGFNVRTQRGHRNDGTRHHSRTRNSKDEP